ncbi:MAG: fumarylacetoacetate hydrolase family protein [Candidatus Bathyarchaeia archaeon]
MRLCRFEYNAKIRLGLYYDDWVVDLKELFLAYSASSRMKLPIRAERFPASILAFLPPNRGRCEAARRLKAFYEENLERLSGGSITLDADKVRLLAPIPRPPKFFLLAGNYAEHIEESGGKAEEKRNTFPYVFMKPPTTTIINPGDPIRLPSISPEHIDWEVELGVVMGKRGKGILANEALDYVAGYTIVNDVSDRQFRPNPHRKRRPRDEFFDWLHGKWHDTFAPIGPCVASTEAIRDPQNLHISLSVSGQKMQDSNTARMIFSVAEIIEFISSFVTLEPGDIISTGTPSGIGAPKGRFLKPGEVVEAKIEGIGVLRNPVE